MSEQEATFAEAFNLLCGDKLGEGVDRTVFACRLVPDMVVKVEEKTYRYFANPLECKFWNDHEHIEAVAKWLAPCGHMSPDGRILMQRRVDSLPMGYEMPEKVPSFLTDLKRDNFGLLDGRLVCFDYSRFLSHPSTRLKRAEWRS